MAEQRDEKHCYQSKFGGNWITGIQYLAEGMCWRQARRRKIELPNHFWNDKAWDNEFRLQSVHASKLIGQGFTVEAIVNALKTPRGKTVYSLGLKSVLIPLIKYEQKRLATQQKLAQEAIESAKTQHISTEPVKEKPREAFSAKPSALSKLKGLE